MKYSPHRTTIISIFFFHLTVLIFSTSIAAQNADTSKDIQEQLKVLVSNEKPNVDSIRDVQKLLVNLGYDPGPIDGLLGVKTQTALKEWQSSTGSKISNTWLEPIKKKATISGWKCASREIANSHKGPAICGNSVKLITIDTRGSRMIYYSNDGREIPPPTRNCSECEIYTR